MSLRHLFRLPLTLFLCIALVLPGCAGMGTEPDDANDVCRPERAALRSTGDFFAEDIIAGAAVGAIAGGLIGLAAGGNARSAALGALAGGALGAVGGYWRARQKQYADQAQLYQAVYGDLQRENESIDKTQLAFNRLYACRTNEAGRIRADFRAGRISREQAAALMAGVRAHSESDLRLARQISGHIQSRSNDFSYASREVQTNAYGGPAPTGGPRPVGRRPAPQASRAATQVQAATSTNVAKRDQFEQTITRAQNNHTAFELS